MLPTLNLLKAIKNNGSRPHLIYFSSGGQIYGHAPCRIPFQKTDSCCPITLYGIQKLAIENYLRIWLRRDICAAQFLRVADPYGCVLPAIRMQGFIGAALNLLRNSQAVPIIGSDEVVRDYLHLHDFNSAVRKVVQLPVPDKFSVINIGSGRGISVREILEIIKIAIRRKIEVEYCSLPHGAIVPEWMLELCKSQKIS